MEKDMYLLLGSIGVAITGALIVFLIFYFAFKRAAKKETPLCPAGSVIHVEVSDGVERAIVEMIVTDESEDAVTVEATDKLTSCELIADGFFLPEIIPNDKIEIKDGKFFFDYYTKQ